MKILIVGEFSAFSKHLKNGFLELGHTVTILTQGDHFKKLTGEYDDILYCKPEDLSFFGKRIYRSHVLFAEKENIRIIHEIKKKSEKWDVIVVVNPIFVSNSIFETGLKLSFLQKAHRNGCKIILSCCGTDPSTPFCKPLKYYEEKYPNGFPKSWKKGSSKFNDIIKIADCIVPMGYEYKFAIEQYCKRLKLNAKISSSIPVPVTRLENVEFNSCINRKIVIFHGIIREQFKGTKYFRKALERIGKEYSDRVEIIVDGRMPYDQYVKIFNRIDILLDQTNSYCPGINAELAMMNGKVVFSGNEPENAETFGNSNIPIINAIPDSNYIYNELKRLIENPALVDELKHKSREFALANVSSVIVAQKYLNTLQSFNS